MLQRPFAVNHIELPLCPVYHSGNLERVLRVVCTIAIAHFLGLRNFNSPWHFFFCQTPSLLISCIFEATCVWATRQCGTTLHGAKRCVWWWECGGGKPHQAWGKPWNSQMWSSVVRTLFPSMAMGETSNSHRKLVIYFCKDCTRSTSWPSGDRHVCKSNLQQ